MWSRAGREIEADYDRFQSPLKALDGLVKPPRVLHIYSIPKDDAFLYALEQFAIDHSWFKVHRLDGATHFPALEDPQAVADKIEEFTGVP